MIESFLIANRVFFCSWCRAQKTTQDSEVHFKDYSNLPPSKDDLRIMELQNELADTKEKLRSMTSKF